MNLCSFGLHKWPKWGQPKEESVGYINRSTGLTRNVDAVCQTRTCERCGKYVIRAVLPPDLPRT